MPPEVLERIVPAERLLLITSVCRKINTEIKLMDKLPAIVIVKCNFKNDIEKVTKGLEEMLKWCHIQKLVMSVC